MKSDRPRLKRKPFAPSPTAAQAPDAAPYVALLALVFLSGFAALVYELLWFRQLGLVFGNTVQAAATVLAAFMVGLAWGAHRAKRWIARATSPVRLFGFIEAGIGLYALLVPAAFALANFCYQRAAQHLPEAVALLIGLRFLLALLVLFVPTVLMGASLPVLAEAALGSRQRFATKLGLLYGSNTAGATVGVLACGFLLVPQWGVQATNLLAAGVNLAVGGLAVLLARRSAQSEIKSTTVEPRQLRSRRTLGLLAVAALCGGLALAFETVWFRALVLVLGSTSHSFAIMVACFLLGLALGSAVLGRLADRADRAAWALAVSLAGIGVWTLISMQIYHAAPDYFLRLLLKLNFTWTGMLWTKAALGAIFLVPLAVLSGLAFTAVVRLLRDGAESAGRAVGAAFSVNALGSATGAAVAGFVMLPALGLEWSLLILGGVAVLSGLTIAWLVTATSTKRKFAFVTAVLVVVAGVRLFSSPWDPLLLSSGPYFTPRANISDGKVRLHERLSTVELVLYREGTTATVDVKRTSDGRLYFSSDGKVEADASPQSMVLQRMMGHLPMLVHPNPRRVLNIGLGAGVTAGALTCYPGAQIEVADIEPAVTNIAAFWASRNHDLIRRGKFQLHINDGRNHLLVTTNRYDVITSDPFEPVVAGAASLYTMDHFQLARSRLAAGGVMAQFLPLYELSREDLLTILRSFARVFPRTSVFFTGTDTILLGMTDDTALRLDAAAAKMTDPEVRASLAEIGINRPERLLDMLLLEILPGSSIVEDGPVNTDNRPIIEFSAPKSALDYRPDVNQKIWLDRFHDIPLAYLAGLTPEAVVEVQNGHAALRALLEASLLRGHGDLHGGVQLLREAAKHAPASPIVRNELSQSLILLAAEAKTPAEALEICREAVRVDPTDFWAIYNLVVRADAVKESALADEHLRRGLELYPDAALLLALRGKRAGLAGDNAAALRDYETVLQKLPRCADFWRDYAYFLKRAGRTADADAAAERVRQLSAR
jgi:spermidine synthase